ncbi:MAG: hypothetical protein BWY09_02878 [Candidatus Hydrogenedentes bacterium ADurb.Bin179]|nr:MAG: hypothetical protein BWY09_02878 [Candidatus Hydrogenedentes bacterium ADurb.Bin179]
MRFRDEPGSVRRGIQQQYAAAPDGLEINLHQFFKGLKHVIGIRSPEPFVVQKGCVHFHGQPGIAVGIGVGTRGAAGQGVRPLHGLPGGFGGDAFFVPRPAQRGVGPLEHHGPGRVLLEDVTQFNDTTAVEPEFGNLAVPGEHLGPLAAQHLVVLLLLGRVGRFAAAADARAPLIVAGIDVDAELQPVTPAAGGQVAKHVSLPVFPGNVSHAVFRGFRGPPAEPAGMLGHEENLLRAKGLGGLTPLFRV